MDLKGRNLGRLWVLSSLSNINPNISWLDRSYGYLTSIMLPPSFTCHLHILTVSSGSINGSKNRRLLYGYQHMGRPINSITLLEEHDLLIFVTFGSVALPSLPNYFPYHLEVIILMVSEVFLSPFFSWLFHFLSFHFLVL